jgi:nitroreductase
MMTPEQCSEIRKDLSLTPEQAEQFLRSRRSIRKYKNRIVERPKLNTLMQMAGYAPSSHNGRPVHLLVIEDPREVHGLAGLVVDWMRLMLKSAPAVVAPFHFDRTVARWDGGADPICRGAPHLVVAHASESARMAPVDCILALAYADLGAPTLGLGTTWAGYVMSASQFYPALNQALALPDGHKCFGALMVGYPTFKFARMPVRNAPPVEWRSAPANRAKPPKKGPVRE